MGESNSVENSKSEVRSHAAGESANLRSKNLGQDLVLDRSGLAGNAEPIAVEFDPGIDEAAAHDDGFAALGPFPAIDAGDDDAFAIRMRDGILSGELVWSVGVVLYVFKKLFPGAKRTIVIDVDHGGSKDMGESGNIFALLGAIPDRFESENFSFILGVMRFILCDQNKASENGKADNTQ